jgi:putative FmdB family regulatory protein
MPIFEFECLECHAVFEKLVRKAGVDADVACPKCGARRVEEKLSTFSSTSSSGGSAASSNCAPGGG